MRRPRPRPRAFWAWTLTLTAALLAVVWVGSMKIAAFYGGKQSSVAVFGGSASVYLWDWFAPEWNVGLGMNVSDQRIARWWFSYTPDDASTESPAVWHFPLWPFVLLTGVPGVWMLIRTRTHTNPNACPACGYDRTGLPQSSTGPAPCPECGKGAGSV